jgi:cytochrome d ubiquinol oxidase subunit II
MDLQVVWFVLIVVLWSGYFLLEGFDFGVGMLLPFVPRNESERGAMFESIGPVWDGNEVWLVVAAGATFAAFPTWYATMFSGFYLALLLLLFFLIIRVVSFEWRSKSESPRWRAAWLWANAFGSAGIALVWGIALANLIHGVPIDSNGDYDGNLVDLFTGYTVFAGIAVLAVAAFLIYAGRYGLAFTMTALGTVATVATLFTGLYPRVMVSSTDFSNSLDVSGAASQHYTLAVMTVVALITLPIVLLYQSWSYYVFRARVTGEKIDPSEAISRTTG